MTDTSQDPKNRLILMESNLRLAGQKLDLLWEQARTATGQARVNIHKQIGPLRIKMKEDRIEQEALKKAGE